MTTDKAIKNAQAQFAAQKTTTKRLMLGLIGAYIFAIGSFAYLSTNPGQVIKKVETPCQQNPSGLACAKLALRIGDARVRLCASHPGSFKCRLSVEYACSNTTLAGLGCPRLETLPARRP